MLLLPVGCTTTTVGVTYDAAAVVPVGETTAATVALGEVVDQRGHGATWLGAIRGGFGNPLKTLETAKPVREVVRDAFRDGLVARNLLGQEGEAPLTLQVAVIRYDSNQVGRREAHADFDVWLMDSATNSAIHQARSRADKVEGSMVTLDAGIFASTEDLRKVANDVLQEAVDGALDDPRFRATVEEAARRRAEEAAGAAEVEG